MASGLLSNEIILTRCLRPSLQYIPDLSWQPSYQPTSRFFPVAIFFLFFYFNIIPIHSPFLPFTMTSPMLTDGGLTRPVMHSGLSDIGD